MDYNDYVPNDCHLDDETFIYLIRDLICPGKSTYMRQVAIISIMAQNGSIYVPCDSATLPIFDQILLGLAADDLVSGKVHLW